MSKKSILSDIYNRLSVIEDQVNELRYNRPRFTLIKIEPKTMITLSCIFCVIIESLILYKVW